MISAEVEGSGVGVGIVFFALPLEEGWDVLVPVLSSVESTCALFFFFAMLSKKQTTR